MSDKYIMLDKSKAKKIGLSAALAAVIVFCFIWVFTADPFFGFGYHDFGEQLITLILEILVPLLIMTATDCLMTAVFKKRFLTIIIAETVLICAKRCYSFLGSLYDSLFGFTDPVVMVALSVTLYTVFFLLLFFVYMLALRRLIAGKAAKTNKD